MAKIDRVLEVLEREARAAAERGEGSDEILPAIAAVLVLRHLLDGTECGEADGQVTEAQIEAEVGELVQEAASILRDEGGVPITELEATLAALRAAVDNFPGHGAVTDLDAAALALGRLRLAGI